jgi:exo-1,4-beta-D-glucosaminidase
VTGNAKQTDGWVTADVTLKNESNVPAFFVRAEIVNNANGDEILPITWSDNYVTVFGGESMTLEARYRVADSGELARTVRVQGHNLPVITATLESSVSATGGRH